MKANIYTIINVIINSLYKKIFNTIKHTLKDISTLLNYNIRVFR